MTMHVAFVDGTYPNVVASTYRAAPGLAHAPWHAQCDALLASEFGCWDSWAVACRYHGVGAEEVIVGAPALDAAIASARHEWAEDAVVVLRHPSIDRQQWAAIAEKARATVLMVTSEAPPDEFLRTFDCVVTAFPHYARDMAARGFPVHYLPLAFDPRRLGLAPDSSGVDQRFVMGLPTTWDARKLLVTFVGGLGVDRHWRAGQHAVAAVAEATGDAFSWWGYAGADQAKIPETIKRRWRGEAWGRDYFATLGRSRVTVNRHGEVHTSPRADARSGFDWWLCNMRAFEATGMGACLVTEGAANLRDFFEPWDECVPYLDPREAAMAATYLLEHQDVAERIAAAGQRRTLREHTYVRRAASLLPWLEGL